MKKKNLFILLGLLALLSLSIALYFLVPQGEKEEAGGGDGQTASPVQEVTVDNISKEDIVALEVKKNGKTSYCLVKEKDSWKVSGQEAIPLDESKVTELFGCLAPVKAAKTLERTEDSLKDYGLEKPAYTIIVKTKEETYQYDIGIEVPVEGGYYGVSSTDNRWIYCMSASLVSDLNIDTNSLALRDELPEIDEDSMVYVSVDNRKGRDFEAEYAEEGERVNSYSKWNITKPMEKPLATSSKNWSTFLGYFNAMTFGNLVSYGEDNLGKYGLDIPSSIITVRYFETKADYQPESGDSSDSGSADSASGEETVPEKYREYHTLKVRIGKKKSESYYACLDGSDHVYLLNGDVVEKMTKLNLFEAMDHCVYATLATKIDGYEAVYGNTKLTVTRTSEKKEESSGESSDNSDKEKNIWTLNGKTISAEEESDFLTPYSSAYLLEYSAVADDSVKPKGKKPVLTMIYHESARDVTVSYYPYDGTNFYRVDRDGMNYFLVDKRSVDDIIKSFRKIEKLAE